MLQAKMGDRVKVHCTGYTKEGNIFSSSREKEPLEFILGERKVLPVIENAIIGMNEGDTTTVSISPETAYGKYREDFVFVVERTKLPVDIDPQIGMELQIRSHSGALVKVIIKDISEETVTLDGNHPLAGKELIFKIELLEIV